MAGAEATIWVRASPLRSFRSGLRGSRGQGSFAPRSRGPWPVPPLLPLPNHDPPHHHRSKSTSTRLESTKAETKYTTSPLLAAFKAFKSPHRTPPHRSRQSRSSHTAPIGELIHHTTPEELILQLVHVLLSSKSPPSINLVIIVVIIIHHTRRELLTQT